MNKAVEPERLLTRIKQRIDILNQDRAGRKISPSGLSRQIAGHPDMIRNLERQGSIPKHEKLLELAHYLGVSVDWLKFGLEPEDTDPSSDEVINSPEISASMIQDVDYLSPDIEQGEEVLYDPSINEVGKKGVYTFADQSGYPIALYAEKVTVGPYPGVRIWGTRKDSPGGTFKDTDLAANGFIVIGKAFLHKRKI